MGLFDIVGSHIPPLGVILQRLPPEPDEKQGTLFFEEDKAEEHGARKATLVLEEDDDTV